MAVRKREDEVFPTAVAIDIGASSHWVPVPPHLAQAAGEEPVRVKALTGNWREQHRFVLKQALGSATRSGNANAASPRSSAAPPHLVPRSTPSRPPHEQPTLVLLLVSTRAPRHPALASARRSVAGR